MFLFQTFVWLPPLLWICNEMHHHSQEPSLSSLANVVHPHLIAHFPQVEYELQAFLKRKSRVSRALEAFLKICKEGIPRKSISIAKEASPRYKLG